MRNAGKKLVAWLQILVLVCSLGSVIPGEYVHAEVQPMTADTGRELLNFNSGWGFYRGDLEGAEAVDYDDSGFVNVTIPHTMRLEKKNCNGGSGTYKGIGWYRRYFTLGTEYAGKKINLDFEGVMIDSEVYLNGEKLYTRNGGYVGFSVDITDKIRLGETNVLAVRVSSEDNPDTPPGRPENNLDFHYYGGIYRDVTMRITEPVYISDPLQADETASGGVFVTYSDVSDASAVVQVKTHVVNDAIQAANVVVKQSLKDAEGNVAAGVESNAAEIPSEGSNAFTQKMTVTNPALWHPEHPYLYTLETSVYQDGTEVDKISTKIGIRTITFKADGFYINGERLYLRGANRHQSFENVGDAGSNSMQYRDAMLMKESGFNAVRAAHYPQDPAFLAACDEVGLVVVECQPGWQNFTNTQTFYDRTLRDTREMIRRDRNHPSVVLWESSLNETGVSETWVQQATQAAHEEYPGDQLFTASDYGFYGSYYEVCYKVQDTNWKSDPAEWQDFDPQKPFFTREWGDFEGDSKALRSEGTERMNKQITTRQRYLDGNGYSDWGGLDASDRIGGYFLWSFNDYSRGSNSKTLGSGVVDIDRYEKNCFYWLKSMQPARNDNYGPVVFISSDYTEESGLTIPVFSNCDSVKLYQNGVLVQEISRETAGQSVPNIMKKGGSPIFYFQLAKFEAGTLKAEGILDGKVIAAHEVRTPGQAVGFEVEINDKGIPPVADGSDQVSVYIKAVDANGTVVPDYQGQVHLRVTGEGELIGKDIPRIKVEDQLLENGIGSAFIRTTKTSGTIQVTASADQMTDGTASIETNPYSGIFVPDAAHAAWEGGVEKLEEPQLINLAVGKKVTVSSEQGGNEKSHAVDDDESTRWCASGDNFPQWLQVDLGQKYAVSGFRTLWENGNSVCKYLIEASEDGTHWTTAVDMSQNDKANGSQDTQMVKTEGRYFRIHIRAMSEGWASFYEFMIFKDEEAGEVDPGEIIPDEAVKGITATGGEVEGRGTDKLRDGITEIGSGWLSQSKEFPQTVTLEFEEPQNLLGSRIYWEKDSSWYTYDLEISSDGENWEKVIDSLRIGGQHYKAETFAEMKQNVRFARITIKNIEAGGNFVIGMAEWILYGYGTVPGPIKEYDFASDLDWESASTDYGSVQKDQAAYGGKQALHSAYGVFEFEKGIGTDTNSEVIYNVEGKRYTAFEAYIGINAKAGKQGGEAIFKIYKDDELVYTSPVKMRDDDYDFVSVDIAGAKKIKLVTEWNDNPDNSEARYNTHTNWADARFYYTDNTRREMRRVYDLETKIQRASRLYTMASFEAYQSAMEQAAEVLPDSEVSQADVKVCAENLKQSIDGLKKLTDLSKEELLEEFTLQKEALQEQLKEVQKQAQAAKEAAETAQDAADQAKKEAENAKTTAAKAQKELEDAQERADVQEEELKKLADQAQKAQEEADEANTKAQEAQAEADNAKTAAESAQAEAEEARTAAAQVQKDLEEAQKKADAQEEELKKLAEQAKQAQEAAEEAQKRAQEAIQAAEAARIRAEEAEKAALEAKAKYEQGQITMTHGDAAKERAEFAARKAALKSVRSPKKKQAKVTWKAVAGAEGYVIQYAANAKFKKAKQVTVKSGQAASRVIRKLTSGRKYCIRIKAYRTFEGVKVYSKYSKKKSVKIK